MVNLVRTVDPRMNWEMTVSALWVLHPGWATHPYLHCRGSLVVRKWSLFAQRNQRLTLQKVDSQWWRRNSGRKQGSALGIADLVGLVPLLQEWRALGSVPVHYFKLCTFSLRWPIQFHSEKIKPELIRFFRSVNIKCKFIQGKDWFPRLLKFSTLNLNVIWIFLTQIGCHKTKVVFHWNLAVSKSCSSLIM